MRKSGGGGGGGFMVVGGGGGWAGGGGGGGNSISKAIGALNKSGTLQAPIQFNEAIGPLQAAGEHTAIQLLEELAMKGHDITNPTAWLTKAALRKGGGGGGWAGGSSGSTISKAIGVLNKSGMLVEPINYNEAIGPLSACGDALANQLIAELAEKGASIQKPTAWLVAAASRKGGGKGGFGAGTWVQVPAAGGWGAPMMMGGGDSRKISKTIGWMNKNCEELVDKIKFDEVSGPLMMAGEREACKLLKELEEKAADIKNPTAWLKSAAMRRA